MFEIGNFNRRAKNTKNNDKIIIITIKKKKCCKETQFSKLFFSNQNFDNKIDTSIINKIKNYLLISIEK